MTRPAVERLKRRAEFVALSRAKRSTAQPGLVLQAAKRRDLPGPLRPGLTDNAVRIGFTASKKVGGAVQRNRAKRRLRAIADEVLVPHAKAGVDFVLIARAGTLDRRFDDLRTDMEKAMKRLKVWTSSDDRNTAPKAHQPSRQDNRGSSE
jgi:ribonuclease P protein component